MTPQDPPDLEHLQLLESTERRMWHVTLTVAGDPIPDCDIRGGLEQLARERPFLLTGRYAPDRAEVRYWEEAPDAGVVTSLALRLWATRGSSPFLASRLGGWPLVKMTGRLTMPRPAGW